MKDGAGATESLELVRKLRPGLYEFQTTNDDMASIKVNDDVVVKIWLDADGAIVVSSGHKELVNVSFFGGKE